MKEPLQPWEDVLRILAAGQEPDAVQWARLPVEERELLENLRRNGLLGEAMEGLDKLEEASIWQALTARIVPGTGAADFAPRTIPVWRRTLRYAAILSIPLLVGGAGWWWVTRWSDASRSAGAGLHNSGEQVAGKVSADHKKATLILGDGRAIDLDRQVSGNVATADGARITNADTTTIQYTLTGPEGGSSQAKTLSYNSLVVPRGGEYALVLADGTHVWMNADSRLRYPVHFNGAGDREVFLEKGEAYFEVAKSNTQPFVVHVAGMNGAREDIRVLGTAFNVNTYAKNIRTTLVEGKVQLTAASAVQPGTIVLLPDQQAVYDADNGTLNRNVVDVLPIVAWKNGWMEFENQRLGDVMEEIGRWYDLDIRFAEESLREVHFGGKVKRHQSVENILAVMERTGSVHFSIKDRTIYVSKFKAAHE